MRRLVSSRAFTLIELLIVILIVGILVAVAAPSFLGQTDKAHDSRVQQNLTVAYRAAKASAVEREGQFVNAGFSSVDLAAAIQASEPQLRVVSGDCPTNVTLDPNDIVVDAADTSGDSLHLCADPERRVWDLYVIDGQLQPFGEPTIVDGSGAPIVVAPSSNSAPQISGTAQVGQTLTASQGTWAGSSSSYAYQWQSSTDGTSWINAAGVGATTASYVVPAADLDRYLRVTVTAQNTAGSASSASAAAGPVLPSAPANEVQPVVVGAPQVGADLEATPGSWTGNPSGYAYQWQSSADGATWINAPGVGATTAIYTVSAADLARYLRVVVTAQNAGGTGAASSEPTSRVLPAAPSNQSPPQVSGTAQVGQTLSATSGSWMPEPDSYFYQWQVSTDGTSWVNASGTGATTASYTVPATDEGQYLRVTVTAQNAGGSSSASSQATSQVLPATPSNQSSPQISGTAQVDQMLAASPGTWTDNPTAYAYQWQVSTDGTSWANATGTGATTASYTVPAADEGKYLRVVVQAQNAGGSSSASSQATEAVLPAAPSNQSSPQISGTAQVGQTLSATTGSWTGSPTSYAYQWQVSTDGASWTNATGTGATTASYTVPAADEGKYLRVVVQAQNVGGSSSASSQATSAVLPLTPASQGSGPQVSGTAQVSQTLVASPGSWTGSPTSYAYQWQVSTNGSSWTNATGTGATTASYTVPAADEGRYLRVTVTAQNAGGSGSASSQATSAVLPAAPSNQTAPAISDTTPLVGQTLVASPGSWTGSPTSYAYQWQVSTNGSSWTNATGTGAATASYTVADADLGRYLRVTVTAQNAGGAGAASSSATSAVATVPPANQSPPQISGTVQVGQTLTASPGTWTGSGNSYSYLWQYCQTRPGAITNSNPSTWWRFTSGSGYDQSGNGSNVVSSGSAVQGYGGATLDTCPYQGDTAGGNAWYFPGATYSTGPTANGYVQPASFSVESWFYFSGWPSNGGTNVQVLIASGNFYGTYRGYYLYSGPGYINFAMGNGCGSGCGDSGHRTDVSVNGIALNTWYHVVASYDAPTRTQRLYLNGALVGSRSDADLAYTAGTNVYIGGDGYAASSYNFYGMQGVIDEMIVYPRALSGTEVSAHWQATTPAWTSATSGQSYTLAAGDRYAKYRVRVTASNSAGSGVADSAETVAVP